MLGPSQACASGLVSGAASMVRRREDIGHTIDGMVWGGNGDVGMCQRDRSARAGFNRTAARWFWSGPPEGVLSVPHDTWGEGHHSRQVTPRRDR